MQKFEKLFSWELIPTLNNLSPYSTAMFHLYVLSFTCKYWVCRPYVDLFCFSSFGTQILFRFEANPNERQKCEGDSLKIPVYFEKSVKCPIEKSEMGRLFVNFASHDEAKMAVDCKLRHCTFLQEPL